ncbi:hypothetical protein [Chelatococcus sp. YT9]|uniref:hypothetical protein n=1 Tax=Chelatococcus sp. YT9 TaxID=2835635 RepID=UPI001BCF8928|nr:hypothetical protein [Chelatococcus sp. YT9]MBS7701467.1 hypothetical protein [Chelatococcus sp. YT9]
MTSDPVADVPSSKEPDVSAPSDPESSTAVREYHATNDSIILIIERIKEENASWSVSNIFGLSGGDVAIVLANSEYDTLRLITEDGSAITIFAEDPSQVKPGLYPDFM